jgi:hypothetical protein
VSTKTRLQLRDIIRTQLEVDSEELPDATIDPWLEDGFARSLAVEDRWPFLADEWTLTTVSGTVSYAKSSFVNASNYTVDQISYVEDVTIVGYEFEVKNLAHDKAKRNFGLGGIQTAVPAYWSERGTKFYVWPSPMVRNLRIDGYRKPSWASGDSVVPDCDERLHLCLAWFGCAMAYAQQEDEVLSQQYISHWQAALKQAHESIMKVTQVRPIILSGGDVAGPW